MKNNSFKAVFFAAAGIVFSFSGCKDLLHMEMPETISIATDADFSANLGTIKYNLSESLSSDSITDQMKESLGSRMGIYNYIADDDPLTDNVDESDVLSYLIHYPVYEIPIDVGTYLDDLDFDSVFGSTDFGFNFEQSLELPALGASGIEKVSASLTEDFHQSVADTLHTNDFDVISIPETGAVVLNAEDYLVDSHDVHHNSIVIECDAEKIFYKSGSAIKMTFTRTDAAALGSDFSFTLRAKISTVENITNESEQVISKSYTGDNWSELKDGGLIELPLDCASGLPEKFWIKLEGHITGGVLNPLDPVVHKYSAAMTLSDGTEIVKIQNIKKHSSDLGITDQTFDMEIPTAEINGWFKSATIKEGSIKISTDAPSTWSGITTNISMKFDGSDIAASKIVNGPDAARKLFDKVVDLSDITITPGPSDIPIRVNVGIEVYGATIIIDDSVNEDLSISYEYGIQKLKNVMIEFEDAGGIKNPKYENIQLVYELSTGGGGSFVQLSKELTQYVKKITFGSQLPGAASGDPYYKHNSSGAVDSTTTEEGLGFRFKLTNTLPTDDLVMKVHSSVMNFDLTKSLPVTAASGQSETWVNYPEVDFTALDSSIDNYVDFKFEITSKQITLDEVTLGDSYKFGFQFDKMIYDWDYVVLNSDGSRIDGSNDLDSFDLSSLLSGLSFDEESIRNIQISNIPVFFYAQKPESSNASLSSLISGLALKGDLKIDYNYKDYGWVEGDPLLTDTFTMLNNQTLSFMTENVPWPEDPAVIVTSDEYKTEHASDGKNYDSTLIPFIAAGDSTKCSFKTDLSEIINKFPESMKFNYSLGLSGGNGTDAIVYSESIKDATASGEDVTSVKIDMAILLSFSLKLKGDITIDAMKYYDEDWESSGKDLLFRDDASDYEDYVKYCKSIEKIKMSYRVINEIFDGLDLEANFNDVTTGINRTITLYENRYNELAFTGKEIERILTMYPFHPTSTISIKGGTVLSPKPLIIKKSTFDSEQGACLGASVTFEIHMTDKNYIKVWGGEDD